MCGIDLTLHLDLHGENLVGFADDFHSHDGVLDKRIERQHREDGPSRPGGRDVVDPQQSSCHGLTGDPASAGKFVSTITRSSPWPMARSA